MSTLRDRCTQQELMAHSILDRVRAGENVERVSVNWALSILGEPWARGKGGRNERPESTRPSAPANAGIYRARAAAGQGPAARRQDIRRPR